MVVTRGKAVWEEAEGRSNAGEMETEGDLAWSGERTMQYTDDVYR